MTDRPIYPNEGKPPTDERDNAAMLACPRFESCGANMCPKDRHLDYRTWYVGEDVCPMLEHRHLGFIRRQRQLNKRRSPSYANKLWTYQELAATAPQKRVLSAEQIARLKAMSRPFRFGKKANPTVAEVTMATRTATQAWVGWKHPV